MTRKKCIKLIMGTMGLPQPLNQGGGFRKTGHSLLIIIARG